MRITVKQEKRLVRFVDLNLGEPFRFEGTVYLCVAGSPGGKNYFRGGADLVEGLVLSFDGETMVEPLVTAGPVEFSPGIG